MPGSATPAEQLARGGYRRGPHRGGGARAGWRRAGAEARGGADRHEHPAAPARRVQDQSPWIDFIDRQVIESGRLAELVGDGIRGLTSNPTIFAKAVATGQYDELIRRGIEAGDDTRRIFEEIADRRRGRRRRHAAPGLRRGGRGRWLRLDRGRAGPGRRLRTGPWSARGTSVGRLARPERLREDPCHARPACRPIEAAIAEGININITLMFSVDVYRDVARAYIAGLRRRLARGGT